MNHPTATWWLQPRDSIMARNARPADNTMTTLPFPWPSTLAGALRTHIGFAGGTKFSIDAKDARAISVQGPLLAERDGDTFRLLPPAPKDTLWMEIQGDPQQARLYRLTPQPVPEDVTLDTGFGDLELLTPNAATGKHKPTHGPMFWSWEHYQQWLLNPPQNPITRHKTDHGVTALPQERRTHVAIDPHTNTAQDGALFSTEMLRFTILPPTTTGALELSKRRELGLLLRCQHKRLQAGTVILGGERRLGALKPTPHATWPAFPNNGQYKGCRRLRLILLTPAIFKNGFKPGSKTNEGLPKGARLVAAAVGRPEIISGWDIEKRQPKCTRRMASAGSVYWVELDHGVDPDTWASNIWFKSISDDPQDRMDGFGLCAVGRA